MFRLLSLLALLVVRCAADPSPSPSVSPSYAPKNDDCEYHKADDKCSYVRSDPDCQGTLIQYLELYACNPHLRAELITIFVFWMALCLYLLGTTAQNFFCANLDELSRRMNLSQRLAGVTLLSLGNGAPDIFSSIAAVRDGQLGLVVGDITGAGMFVCSVVVSTVLLVHTRATTPLAAAASTDVPNVRDDLSRGQQTEIVRDMCMYAVTAILMAIVLHYNSLTKAVGGALLGLYVLFVLTVVISGKFNQRPSRTLRVSLMSAANEVSEAQPTSNLEPGSPASDGLRQAQGADGSHDDDDQEVQFKSSKCTPKLWALYFANISKFIQLVVWWCETPFTILRTMTIPNPSVEEWNVKELSRLKLAISMAFVPLLFAFWREALTVSVGSLQVWMVLLIISPVLGVVVFVTCPESSPPPYSAVVSLIGFLASAVWVDLIASELVEVLAAIGHIVNISQLVLGITILAWGNSLGDLTANSTMAKNNRTAMALTACYAGPLFNALIGVGVGVLMRRDKAPASLPNAQLLSFCFLICTLVVSALIVLVMGFARRWFAILLFANYGIYLAVVLWYETTH
eukprot:c20839_g1_i1.p1 GENE.c20839_g1_i1~~c20839_g1_i1.p1  ORF type:complete len:579 (-),score=143.77 c20839_g1_i1:272-1984(-)